MPSAILATKLRLPFTRPELVPRARLVERMAEGLRGPLTLITAPAGFGKTTLAAAAVTGGDTHVAWLSLDRDDNQPERFLTYLAAALQESGQAIGGEAAQMLAASPQAPPEMVLTSLINDLDKAGEEITLVLDDYQFISNQAIHEGVTFMLEHCPKTFHLVIATRSDPPLPTARLRARGQIAELRAADLRFNQGEAAQFLNEVMGLDLDAGSVTALEARTEGWIAGLQMAALSMRERADVHGFIEGFSGTSRYILDYLMEEVLAGQPPEIQHFLLYTSILERLTAQLCDALLESPEGSETGKASGAYPKRQSADVLAYLDRINLFLVPLDDERRWYRYHHLFADLLRARLLQSRPELAQRLHVQASAWLEQQGLIGEAIHHLFAAGESEQAADLIERYGPQRLDENDASILQMAENLPAEEILRRPKLGLYLAWTLIVRGQIGEAMPLLNNLRRGHPEAEPEPGREWVQTFVATALAFLAPPPSAPELDLLPDYSAVEEIPAKEQILRNAADILYGMALGRRGDLERAVEVSLKGLQREKRPPGSLDIPTLAPFLSRITLMQGRLHAAASLCHQYLDPILGSEKRFIYTTGGMQIDLGEALLEWNTLEEAEKYIREGLKANEHWRNIMTEGFGLVALARLLLAKEAYTEAMQAVEALEKRMQGHSRPREFAEDLSTLRVRVQLASGDLQSASQWAERTLVSEDFRLQRDRYRLTLAHIRLAQGQYAEVERLLAGPAPSAEAGSRITRQLETNLLLAVAIARQQRLTEAFALLETSLALAEPEGYVRVFLDAGEAVRELLAAYVQSPAHSYKDYAQKILEAYPRTNQANRPNLQPAGMVEALTARELEVLQLISQGYSNKLIAQELIVAPGTIKAHAASLYRKLEVANRTEAVARARQLGILP